MKIRNVNIWQNNHNYLRSSLISPHKTGSLQHLRIHHHLKESKCLLTLVAT